MGQSRPLFVFYFRSFLVTISIQIEKSKDGVLGIRTRGRRMVGADKTTELWRPPFVKYFYWSSKEVYIRNDNTNLHTHKSILDTSSYLAIKFCEVLMSFKKMGQTRHLFIIFVPYTMGWQTIVSNLIVNGKSLLIWTRSMVGADESTEPWWSPKLWYVFIKFVWSWVHILGISPYFDGDYATSKLRVKQQISELYKTIKIQIISDQTNSMTR